eukprot:m51a1_g5194 hypothetical protein (248) ;mRNA; r:204789-205694
MWLDSSRTRSRGSSTVLGGLRLPLYASVSRAWREAAARAFDRSARELAHFCAPPLTHPSIAVTGRWLRCCGRRSPTSGPCGFAWATLSPSHDVPLRRCVSVTLLHQERVQGPEYLGVLVTRGPPPSAVFADPQTEAIVSAPGSCLCVLGVVSGAIVIQGEDGIEVRDPSGGTRLGGKPGWQYTCTCDPFGAVSFFVRRRSDAEERLWACARLPIDMETVDAKGQQQALKLQFAVTVYRHGSEFSVVL